MLLLYALFCQISHSTCPRFACHPRDSPLPSTGMCMYTRNDTKFVAECDAGYYCPMNVDSEEVLCQPVPTAAVSWPGEHCDKNSSCVTALCVDSLCMGNAHMRRCKTHSDCHVGLYCSIFGLCMIQMAERMLQPCRDEFDCRNDRTCANGRCVKYFSLPEQHQVTECSNNQSLACASSMCAMAEGKGMCLKAVKSDRELPMRCHTSADCTSSWYSTEWHSFPFLSDCECAWDDRGSSFCSLFPGDKLFQDYMRKVTYYLERSSNCHTQRRMSPSCMRRSLTKRRFQDLAQTYLSLLHFPQLQGSASCVTELLARAYWSEWSSASTLAAVFPLISLS